MVLILLIVTLIIKVFSYPTFEDCVTNNIVKTINETTGKNDSKNTKDDIDEEYYSLQYWLKLAEKGEMIVIDMLHAPDDMIIETSPLWEELRANRSKFYTKNLSGYLGYIRKQTAKYGIKGSRLAAMSEVIKLLTSMTEISQEKLTMIWNDLPINEYCKYIDPPQEERWRMYEVCGKKFGETITLEYLLERVQLMYDSYGHRAKMAEKNEGIDWKAVSHAVRASDQLLEIYKTGNLKFPLKNAAHIKKVKEGKLHYIKDNIGKILEYNLELVELHAEKSGFPDKFDIEWAQSFIINAYQK